MGGIHVDEKKAAKKALRYVLLTRHLFLICART
nr:hypothetical protein [Ligilactobacillus ruminis]